MRAAREPVLLLSKYGLALVAEAPASPEAGRPLTITVKGCDVKESVDAYPWFDSYTTNGTRPPLVQRGRGWRGEQFDWQNAAGGDLKRGSPFMLCGDRCMLYDECAFWTQRKPGKPPQCTFYKSVKGTDKNDGGESGSRKDERVALGSPLALEVVGAAPETPTAPCASGAAPGRWVRGPATASASGSRASAAARPTKKSDADWDFDYAWRPHDCAYERYAPDDVKACLERRGVDVVFLSGDSVIQGCTPAFYEKLGGAPNAPPDKVAADAGVKHVQWSKTVADAKRTLRPFTRAAFDRLHCDKPKIRTHLVQFGGVAVHGFREPYVTYNRSRVFSDVLRAHLEPLQWDFVDAWLPTASRPEGAQDGMHYRPPTCAALMDVFLHGLCREGADAMEVSGCAAN
ncbi:hypothetical protein JL720_8174 [Aureococcus anophagefferens]|nr:hypothetical protein JL720_8174 [Aureococcus anophagefferens]